MASITALLQGLPPASLAETDLARFCAQALGRRARTELPGLAALFGEESLRGYAPSLGAILQSLVETLMVRGIDPQSLDARTVDGLFGGAAFLSRLEKKVSVGRQRLRPGTVVGGSLRQTLGPRLLVLPGVGRELVLVAPVDLAQVNDAHFSVPLGVVLARPAPPEEAEVLRAAWAVIEERFGLDGAEARQWEGRFIAIARRENHDAEAAIEGLATLGLEQRLELWDVLVEHARDQELPEQHRSGRRGLERRLTELGHAPAGSALPAWLEATMTLCDSAYRAAGLDGEVMAGRGPVAVEDIERWAAWDDVAAVGRERVSKLTAEAIGAALIRLSEEEAGRIERAPEELPEALARALASLRDGCLRPRWQRSRWALMGIDPLVLARARVAAGEDTRAIRVALEALAREAAQAERAQRTSEPARAAVTPEIANALETGAGVSRLETRQGAPASGQGAATALGPGPVQRAEKEPAELRRRGVGEPAEQGAATEGRGLRPSRFHLPPMPTAPPPRPAPRVRPRTDFPPIPSGLGAPTGPLGAERTRPPTEPRMPIAQVEPKVGSVPMAPEARATAAPLELRPAGALIAPVESRAMVEPRVARAPSTRVPTQRVPTVRPASESPIPTKPATNARAPEPAPRLPARPRTGAAPHLVTPSQGNDFYDASFRELELIERDLLQRGPYSGAAERVQAISEQAAELHAALGPSARSGDREFQATQRRIEKVQAYLERIGPLLVSQRALGQARPAGGEDKPGLFKRLFGKRD